MKPGGLRSGAVVEGLEQRTLFYFCGLDHSGPPPIQEPVSADWSHTPKTVLVMLAQFNDHPAGAPVLEDVASKLEITKQFMSEQSYGKVELRSLVEIKGVIHI